MSYKCQITGRQSKLGAKLVKVVVLTRPQTYTKMVKDEETREWSRVFAANGWEIVKELNCSQEGADLWNSWSPDEKAVFLASHKR